jgi:Flp pilus assembly protein TadG
VRATTIRGRRRRSGEPGPEAGQSLVEFSLILFPLFLILLAIIQFGLIFNAYVTVTNATRDAARMGSIYVYDLASGLTKGLNDYNRNETIRDSILGSMNILGKTAPYFASSSTWTQSGNTFTSGDLVITYDPSGVTDSDSRVGQRITVKATYHEDLIVPLISTFLPKDSGGRLRLTGEATMVIN